MDIYTFIGIVAIVIFTSAGIVCLAQKYLEFAAYAVELANKRAERAHHVYLKKEKEEYEKCLAEFYKD